MTDVIQKLRKKIHGTLRTINFREVFHLIEYSENSAFFHVSNKTNNSRAVGVETRNFEFMFSAHSIQPHNLHDTYKN